METYTFASINRDQVKKLFNLTQYFEPIQLFKQWVAKSNDFEVEELEKAILLPKQRKLLRNGEAWNEQELYVKFITFLIETIDFDMDELDVHSFSERNLSKKLANITLQGRVDWMVASGNYEPKQPFFFIHEYKRGLEGSGDPVGQLLTTMCVAQILNKEPKKPTLFDPNPVSYQDLPIYGCYVVGKFWYFVILENHDYYISRAYDATDEGKLYEILKLLKAQKQMIIDRLTKKRETN